MTGERYRRLNHARAEFYRVTQNPKFKDFLVSPDLIRVGEKAILFVYQQNGKDITKIVPMEYFGPYMSYFPINKYDEDLQEYTRKGYVYRVPAEVIYNF